MATDPGAAAKAELRPRDPIRGMGRSETRQSGPVLAVVSRGLDGAGARRRPEVSGGALARSAQLRCVERGMDGALLRLGAVGTRGLLAVREAGSR
jgi:hypothetical protein